MSYLDELATAGHHHRGLIAHLDAGADHVGVYPLGDDTIGTLRTIAAAVVEARYEYR
ncbi:hypothetical protein OG225_16615 [Nocardia sp. NBC_01377]|uniref:hypothetical protein n=1 Tax=Nocardia sp. NBC_01377 TaxID=2903595 RepID=UPI003245EF5F